MGAGREVRLFDASLELLAAWHCKLHEGQCADICDVSSLLSAGATAHAASNGAEDGALAAPTDGGSNGSGGKAAPPALDRVLEALLSDRGHSLVSVAVSLGARNLMTAYCEAQHRLAADDRAAAVAAGPGSAGAAGAAGASANDLTNRLLDFLASPRGQQLVLLTVTAFVSSGMRSYLDQTLDLNFYEVRLLAGLGMCVCVAGPLLAAVLCYIHPCAGRLACQFVMFGCWMPGLHAPARLVVTCLPPGAPSQHTPVAPALFPPPPPTPCRTCLLPWPSRSTWRPSRRWWGCLLAMWWAPTWRVPLPSRRQQSPPQPPPPSSSGGWAGGPGRAGQCMAGCVSEKGGRGQPRACALQVG